MIFSRTYRRKKESMCIYFSHSNCIAQLSYIRNGTNCLYIYEGAMHDGGLVSIIMSIVGPAEEQLLKINSFLKWKGKEPHLNYIIRGHHHLLAVLFSYFNLGGGAYKAGLRSNFMYSSFFTP